MTTHKAEWTLTNQDWDTRKEIWKLAAKGQAIKQIVNALELQQPKYPALSRNTVAKVIKELLLMPSGLIGQLLSECPEVEGYLLEKRPNFKANISGARELEIKKEAIKETGAYSSSKEHDSAIFQRQDGILNEITLRGFLSMLENSNRYYSSTFYKICEYCNLYSFVSNHFIDQNLQGLWDKVTKSLDELAEVCALNNFRTSDFQHDGISDTSNFICPPGCDYDFLERQDPETSKFQDNLEGLIHKVRSDYMTFRLKVMQELFF